MSKLVSRRRNIPPEDLEQVRKFIACVRRRPLLYNYTLPQEQRRRTDIAIAWKDVANEIKRSADDCRRRWKNLRDTYHQYRLRKTKFKDCWERWQYKKDMDFLLDIYRPKLKSERINYKRQSEQSDCSIVSAPVTEVEAEANDDANTWYVDENVMIENVLEDSLDIKFCDVDAKKDTAEKIEPYGEVYLYNGSEGDAVSEDHLAEVLPPVTQIENTETPTNRPPDQDELDLFFTFLKSKISKLPSADITALQVEFLSAVFKKEAANKGKS